LLVLEALFGCLYAGWIAVPAAPPSRHERLDRLCAIARDAEPRLVLTTERLRARLGDVGVLTTTDAVDDDAGFVSAVAPKDVAILQYTSGSTGSPRGVVLSHANLMANMLEIAARFGMHAGSHGVIWLPPFHDMGLIGGILQSVAVGSRCTLLAPLAFLRRPVRWLETISRVAGTISGGPNFAYDLCVARVGETEKRDLDLSSWEVAFVGAEPVRAATLARFADAFAPCGFRKQALYPCYGLAEATLMVSGGDLLEGPRLADGGIVSCGRIIDGHALHIVDGEIVVEGPSVARGYWRGEQFNGRVQTGDLGYVRDGDLFVTGRSKALLIVNGRKFHAEDIERSIVESHRYGWPGGVAAIGVDAGEREELVVFQEVTHSDGVEQAIRVALARMGLAPKQVLLVRPGALPRTTSGKVRRDACLSPI
jgi:acyl-CoA synthetase (AMP-forming)/AMP-acid ligase II